MILFKKSHLLARILESDRTRGIEISWVPTMGALHEGHLSLLEAARRPDRVRVCSIFINPTQFNVATDFEQYPVSLEKDIFMLEKAGVDYLFLPAQADIYPEGTGNLERYALGALETTLEGKYRPGHFQGVCQVMSRLMKTIAADHLYMGQKDYQQCMVIQRLLELTHSPTRLHTCPTRREPDGLAMSSRNLRLSEKERKNAIAIYQSLVYLRDHLRSGDLAPLLAQANTILLQHDFRVDYVSIADHQSLQAVSRWDGRQPLVALIAAFQQEVRLIDNMLLTPS